MCKCWSQYSAFLKTLDYIEEIIIQTEWAFLDKKNVPTISHCFIHFLIFDISDVVEFKVKIYRL